MQTVKKVLKWIGIAVLVLAVAGFSFYLIYLQPVLNKMKHTTEIQYDKNLTLVLGGGGNSGILVSDSLVIVIDTKMNEAAKQLSKKVKELAGSKPILVINTHIHTDHSEGNKFYHGATIVAGGNYTEAEWLNEAGKETMPTKWLKETLNIKMGDDTVTVFGLNRNIHTASDVFVYLHKRKMLFGGDVILNQQAPAIMDVADPNGYLYAFDELPKQYNIQHVVPGHGPLGGIEVIEKFHQFFDDMKMVANDDSKKDELVAKYKDWTQVPFVMSPGAVISAFEKKSEQSR